MQGYYMYGYRILGQECFACMRVKKKSKIAE